MMKKATTLEVILGIVLIALSSLFLCIPKQALASPLSMLRAMSVGALHVWGTGDVLRATDLNGNFTFLNTTKVGGGVTLTNTDVASNAAIAHSKLATPALVPKAWGYVGSAACGATPCTVADSSQVSAIARTGAGVYTVTLSYTPANANFLAIPGSGTVNVHCVTNGLATAAPQITIRCYTDTTGAATDAAFSVLVMDS
jgi:hypothetical protein